MANKAAWLVAATVRPLKVDEAPYPEPKADEVIIKNAAVAINPVDWKIQDVGRFIEQYPAIGGEDLAGEIVSIGSNVTGLNVGQRVIAHAHGLGTKDNRHGAFQLFVAVPSVAVAPLPSSLSFVKGSVLPLAVSTAAAGLYQPGFLELPLPSATVNTTDKAKTLVVWGGSSSVGSAVVQLATASGITVFSTASSKNFEFVKSLGAAQVFDHYNPEVINQITDALKGTELVGVYDAISLPDTVKKSAEVIKAAPTKGKELVATVLPPPEDVTNAKGVFALTIFLQYPDVGRAIWGKFVPEALANGRLQAKPDPVVVGKGLEKIQDGLDKQRNGVSAQKVVVDLGL